MDAFVGVLERPGATVLDGEFLQLARDGADDAFLGLGGELVA